MPYGRISLLNSMQGSPLLEYFRSFLLDLNEIGIGGGIGGGCPLPFCLEGKEAKCPFSVKDLKKCKLSM